MGLLLACLVFLLERFGEHTILVVDLAILLLLIHYFMNLSKIARLIRYIRLLNDPIASSQINHNPMAFHVAME
ncbi:TPA_asm: P4 [Picris trirhavirus 1]|nr:MAG: 8 kDa unknown protein [Picris cytorhabdovirus 1]DBA36572.1 TPA_asm: P4 [Picris trirhavirus 1]